MDAALCNFLYPDAAWLMLSITAIVMVALFTALSIPRDNNNNNIDNTDDITNNAPISTNNSSTSSNDSELVLTIPATTSPIVSFIQKTDHQVSFPKKINEHPPIIRQGTSTSVADFFLDEITVPGEDFAFWDIISKVTSQTDHAFLEKVDSDVIAMLLPGHLQTHPTYREMPGLSQRLACLLQTDPEIASKYLLSVFITLWFLGLKIHENGRLVPLHEFNQRAEYIKKNKKQWRILRLLDSLFTCGFTALAQELKILLQQKTIMDAYSLGQVAFIEERYTKDPFPDISKIESKDVCNYWMSRIYMGLTKMDYKDCNTHTQSLPKKWVSNAVDNSQKLPALLRNPIFCIFEKNKPPLLTWDSKRRCWRLPYLQAPSFCPHKAL